MKLDYIPCDYPNIDISKSAKYRTSFGRDNSLLLENIKKYGVLHPLILIKNDHCSLLVSGFRRFEIAQKIRIQNVPAYIFENSNLSEFDAISLSLYENLFTRGFNEIEKGIIIKNLRQEFEMTPETIYQLFKDVISLPTGNKVIEIYEKIGSLSDELKLNSLKLQLQFNTLSILTQLDHSDREIFFNKILIKCQTNYNETKEIYNLLKDISIEKNQPIRNLINDYLSEILDNIIIEPKRKNILIREKLKKLKFPILSKIEERFNSAVKDLNAEKSLNVIPEKFFEGDELEFRFKSKSPEEFASIISLLEKSIKNGKIEKIFKSFQNCYDLSKE